MILKFKFREDYWERSAFQGPNLFIKSLPPKLGYQNYGIGPLPGIMRGETGTVITDKMLSELIRRKQVIIIEEYTDNDKNTEQEGLSDSGGS